MSADKEMTCPGLVFVLYQFGFDFSTADNQFVLPGNFSFCGRHDAASSLGGLCSEHSEQLLRFFSDS